MDRKTKICIWVILIGLANFMAYAIIYMFIGGEAVNGFLENRGGQITYVLQSGHTVSRGVYLYSGIHSISIWLTVAAIFLAMLTLAKERIVSAMRSTIVRGRTLITMLATIITFTMVVITIWFILQFAERLEQPRIITDPPRDVPARSAATAASVGALPNTER